MAHYKKRMKLTGTAYEQMHDFISESIEDVQKKIDYTEVLERIAGPTFSAALKQYTHTEMIVLRSLQERLFHLRHKYE